MNLGADSPPAYRPQSGRVQPKRTGAPGEAPPAYRPLTVTQAKPACAKWAPPPYRAERPAGRTTPLQSGTSAVLQLAKSTTLLENLAKPKVLGLSLSHVVMQKEIEHRLEQYPEFNKRRVSLVGLGAVELPEVLPPSTIEIINGCKIY